MRDREWRGRRLDLALVLGVIALLIAAGVAVTVALTAIGTATKVERISRETTRLARENARNIDQIKRLRAKSVDESCKRSEQQERVATLQVIRTYAFLDRLPPGKPDNLTRAIVAQLPVTYKEAKAARAPSYCNAPGVGLPEPKSPKLPPERSFRYLLR